MKYWRVCLSGFFAILCSTYQLAAQEALSPNGLIYSTSGDNHEFSSHDSIHLFKIKEIIIEGTQKTKHAIVLRELSFKENEEYLLNELVDQFQEAKRRLMNTGLFREVIVSLKSLQGYDAFVKIDVKERWYIYPAVFLKTVNQSFNEWIGKENMNLKRVNYGMLLTYYNFRGRNDKLIVQLMNGYTRQAGFSYEGLYLDKKFHWSSNIGFSYGKNKEVNYSTVNNRFLTFTNTEEFLLTYFRTFLEVNYRPAIKTKHTFGVAYYVEDYADSIFLKNPGFSNQSKAVRYPELYYRMSYFDVDFIPYPTKGNIAEISLRKKGFSKEVNLWQLTVKASKSWPVFERSFFNLRTAGMVKLPFKQSFVTKDFLRSNENFFMQGYENYIVDGVAGGYTKATFSRRIFSKIIRIPSEKFKRLNHIPIKLYAKVYGNAGYVYDPDSEVVNGLNNKLLYSGGFGLDIVTFYDFIFKVEFSFNRLGENGLYLHKKNHF